MKFSRRSFTASLLSLLAAGRRQTCADIVSDETNDWIRGMLLGSLIGDAAGGPVEFADPKTTRGSLPGFRDWAADRQFTQSDAEDLKQNFRLLSYETLRPEPAALGPWKRKAPAGTITDDSRFKIMLIRALHTARQSDAPLSQRHIARQIVDFRCQINQADSPEVARRNEQGLREFRLAARWILGERNLEIARPPARQWGGVPTCAGQMMLLPLAGLSPGQPERAYRQSWNLNFLDNSFAKDFCSALIAGLALLCDPAMPRNDPEIAGQKFLECLADVDPYRLSEVPYVGRPMLEWLNRSEQLVQQAGGRPAELFRLLETKGEPRYWWDAHFTFLVPLSILRFCRFQAVPSIQMCLDFGHDTDSYAQVAGAIAGAIEGSAAFPKNARQQVIDRLQDDYGETVDDWVRLLTKA